jgi:hypothetical protein
VNASVYVYVCARVYGVCVCVFIYIYIREFYIYAYIHTTCIHTYIHTYTCRYPERISTVRRCSIYERGTKVCKAQFALSRFMLEINTVLRCEREANTLRFELDKDRRPLAMEEV